MQIDEAPFRSVPSAAFIATLVYRVFRGTRHAKVEENMNIARKVAIAVVTATLSFGLLGISAPAHADFSWDVGPPLTRRTLD